MGSYVAIHAAAAAPDLFASPVLIGATSRSESDPARFAALEDRIREAGFAAMSGTIAQTMFGDDFLAGDAERVEAWRLRFSALAPQVADVLRAVYTRSDMTRVLEGIDLPVMALGGSQDRAKPASDMAAIALARPGSLFCWVPSAGHTPLVENPSAVAPFLRGWWDMVEQGYGGVS